MVDPSHAAARLGDADEALARVRAIYDDNTAYIRDAFQRFAAGEEVAGRIRACYPLVRVCTETLTRTDTRLSYGFVAGPGRYETTLTRPDLFGNYYAEQFRLLRKNHGVALEVDVSLVPIPVHFAFLEDIHVEGDLDPERVHRLGDYFDLPDLTLMDDSIVNGTYEPVPDEALPLALFTAPRVAF